MLLTWLIPHKNCVLGVNVKKKHLSTCYLCIQLYEKYGVNVLNGGNFKLYYTASVMSISWHGPTWYLVNSKKPFGRHYFYDDLEHLV